MNYKGNVVISQKIKGEITRSPTVETDRGELNTLTHSFSQPISGNYCEFTDQKHHDI